MKQFHRDYLAMQGVIILPKSRIVSRQMESREKENLPEVMQYERD
jgi:hypothetical protein